MRNVELVTCTVLLMFSAACADVRTSTEAPSDEGPEAAQDGSELNSTVVSLRVPLLDDGGHLLSRLNPQMLAAHLPTFTDTVEIRGGAKGVRVPGADKKWNEASALADKAAETLKQDGLFMKTLGEPSDYMIKDIATSICYKGNPKLVVAFIESLADGVFSDQLVIHGWRYRDQKVMDDNIDADAEATFPSIWRNWRGKGAAVLTLSSSSDDGSETNVGLIAKCK